MVGALGGLAACSAGDSSSPTPTTSSTASSSGTGTPSATARSTPATAPTKADWQQLSRSVRGTLVLPSDPTYDQVRLLENPRYDGQRPLAVLSVQSA